MEHFHQNWEEAGVESDEADSDEIIRENKLGYSELTLSGQER